MSEARRLPLPPGLPPPPPMPLSGLPPGAYTIQSVLTTDPHGCPVRVVVKHVDTGLADVATLGCVSAKGWRWVEGTT